MFQQISDPLGNLFATWLVARVKLENWLYWIAIDAALVYLFAAQALYLSNYYIIQNGWWDGRAPGTWIYWSLAVEEHFYLVFPVVYIVLRRWLPSRSRHCQSRSWARPRS